MISLFKVNPKSKTDSQLWVLYSKALANWSKSGYNIFGPAKKQLDAFSEELDARNIDKDLALKEEGRARYEGRPMDMGRCKISGELKEARELIGRYENRYKREYHPLVGKAFDVSMLPMPKQDIKAALLVCLAHEIASSEKYRLERLYVSLSEFQEGVGSVPIVTEVVNPTEDGDPELPSNLQEFLPSNVTMEWQERIGMEYEELEKELVVAGHTELEKDRKSFADELAKDTGVDRPR